MRSKTELGKSMHDRSIKKTVVCLAGSRVCTAGTKKNVHMCAFFICIAEVVAELNPL